MSNASDRNQFSIKTVMFAFAFVAISAASLRYPSVRWMVTLQTTMLIFLTYALVASFTEIYWRGFAIFGWVFYYFHGPSAHQPETSPVHILLESFEADNNGRVLAMTATAIWVFLMAIFGGTVSSTIDNARRAMR